MKTDYRKVFAGARLTILAVALAAAFSLSAFASDQIGFRTTVGEFSVYLAVMPAEFVAGPQPTPERGTTPYQPPAAKDTHHVMVSIFEYRTGRRVSEAMVTARVAALGLSGEKKALEPTAVAGATVFSNSFPMIGRGPFRVDVEFRVPGAKRHEQATFYFTHPSFAPPKDKVQKERKP